MTVVRFKLFNTEKEMQFNQFCDLMMELGASVSRDGGNWIEFCNRNVQIIGVVKEA